MSRSPMRTVPQSEHGVEEVGELLRPGQSLLVGSVQFSDLGLGLLRPVVEAAPEAV